MSWEAHAHRRFRHQGCGRFGIWVVLHVRCYQPSGPSGKDGLPHFSGSPGRCGRTRLRSDPPGDGILLPRQADPAWPFPRSGEFIPNCPLPHLKDSPARSSGFMTCQPMDALPCLVSVAVKEPRDPVQRTARDVTIGAQPSDENPTSRCRHP